MNDFSELLAQKTDTIVAQWVEAARQDQKIESNEQLPYLAIRNSLPCLLEAMATTLSESQGVMSSQLCTQAWSTACCGLSRATTN